MILINFYIYFLSKPSGRLETTQAPPTILNNRVLLKGTGERMGKSSFISAKGDLLTVRLHTCYHHNLLSLSSKDLLLLPEVSNKFYFFRPISKSDLLFSSDFTFYESISVF